MSENVAGPSAPSASPTPVVILVIGMAGSGKTTLIQRLNSHMHMKNTQGYIINLDPAVTQLPYGANIDIRDTVKYKNVMKQYNLGPNGGILTSCNLFATRFDQVISLLEKPRDPPLQYVVVDTPGQIEIFTWSASGAIITELFAGGFPTCIAYVVDTPRCTNPQTFMSNMLQACSILYKTKLPMLLVFNKTDVARHEFALQWMSDFTTFHAALDADQSYASTLSRSLSMVLEEFYQNMRTVGVSAMTGAGMDAFFEGVAGCAHEYETEFKPDMEQRRKLKAEREAAIEAKRQKRELEKLHKDLASTKLTAPGQAVGPARSSPAGRRGGAEEEAEEDEDEDLYDYDDDDDEDDDMEEQQEEDAQEARQIRVSGMR